MEKRYLRLSIFFMIFLFTLIYCGGSGNNGGDNSGQPSVKILIQFPPEASPEPGRIQKESEFPSELFTKQASTQPSVEDIKTITIIVEGDFPTIEETFDFAGFPSEFKRSIPVGKDKFTAEAKDAEGQLLFIGETTVTISPGENPPVIILLSPVLFCTDCADPTCNGRMCDPNDSTRLCVAGQCITPTPPPTPIPTPTPAPEAKADLVPFSPLGSSPSAFCREVNDGTGLEVTVKNQGNADAPASTTRVIFFTLREGNIAEDMFTPAIPAGGSTDLVFDLPSGCFNGCDFRITVDSNNQVNESDEGNNSVPGICSGFG
jgi:CARDB protein